MHRISTWGVLGSFTLYTGFIDLDWYNVYIEGEYCLGILGISPQGSQIGLPRIKAAHFAV